MQTDDALGRYAQLQHRFGFAQRSDFKPCLGLFHGSEHAQVRVAFHRIEHFDTGQRAANAFDIGAYFSQINDLNGVGR